MKEITPLRKTFVILLIFLGLGLLAMATPGQQATDSNAATTSSSSSSGSSSGQKQTGDPNQKDQSQKKDESNPAPPPQTSQPAATSSQTAAPPSQTPASSLPQASGKQPGIKPVSPTTTYESGTVLQVHTRLVVIDVIATDDHGHAVTDLKGTDFSVLEDGKPQKVRAFAFEHPFAPDPNEKIPVLPPNVFTNLPLFPSSSAMSVIVMDVLNTSLTDQAYARQKLLHYLDNMPPNEPTAIYIMGDRLKMVHDFSTDHAALKEAVEKTKLESSLLAESPLAELPGSAGAVPGAGNAQRELEQTRRTVRIEYSLQALQTIAHALAGYEGRKNLIWISAAFPLSINPNISLEEDSGAPFDEMENHGQKVAKTAQILTDSQLAIYPVDPRGLATFSTFSAANGGGGYDRHPAAFGKALTEGSRTLSAAHDTMNLLAENTG